MHGHTGFNSRLWLDRARSRCDFGWIRRNQFTGAGPFPKSHGNSV